MEKKDFGKTPSYLVKIKNAVEKARVDAAENERKRIEEEALAREFDVSEEKRQELLTKLKDRWDELNKGYQLQAHVVNPDTTGKIKRKERLEIELKKTEAAIEALSGGPVTVFNY